jgi:hypothetical protein
MGLAAVIGIFGWLTIYVAKVNFFHSFFVGSAVIS